MSAYDFEREVEMTISREWGSFRGSVIEALRNNLPTASGTVGNFEQFQLGISVASSNKKLYATGALRDSYYEVVESITLKGPLSGRRKISSFYPGVDYATIYANGSYKSATYHGFDYIGQTIRDIDRLYSGITAR